MDPEMKHALRGAVHATLHLAREAASQLQRMGSTPGSKAWDWEQETLETLATLRKALVATIEELR